MRLIDEVNVVLLYKTFSIVTQHSFILSLSCSVSVLHNNCILLENEVGSLEMGVHIRLNSRLEIVGDASSIVNFGYHITDDYCNRR